MTNNEKIERLKETLSEMKAAYYGGFRITSEVEDIQAFEWATKKLEYIKEVYPELFLD